MSLLNTTPIALIFAAALALSSCQASDAVSEQHSQPTQPTQTTPASTTTLPPLSTQFKCLPSHAAIIAAHRATSRDMGLAENALPSLKALHEGGILMAEFDVAGLADGVHILFHDGVWEEDTTGTGPVAAATFAEASTYLLRDNQGNLTSSVPARLDETLAFAKNRLYLEVDFKSSAKYETVIDAIRDADMAEHVILIAYNDGQIKRLTELAPEMIISTSIDSLDDIARYESFGLARNKITGWVGTISDDRAIETAINGAGIPVLAFGRRNLEGFAPYASVLVSSYALSDKQSGPYPGIVGLKAADIAAYEACLSAG